MSSPELSPSSPTTPATSPHPSLERRGIRDPFLPLPKGELEGVAEEKVASISPTLSSVESLRSSIPESYRSLFDTLRKGVMDFCDLHRIPTSSLNNDEDLREATKHLSLPDLAHLSLVLKRLEYLVTHKKPLPPEQDPTFQESLEYAQEHYHLREQYTSQVSLLEQIGILKDGHIEAIDGNRYSIPTLEQIALRLFERRTELSPKHDQGFTKLLLVPFGMSLGTLCETLKAFLLDYKKKHPDFGRLNPLFADSSDRSDWDPVSFLPRFEEVDQDGEMVYDQGKTKAQILEEQQDHSDPFLGWTVHLFQTTKSAKGIAPVQYFSNNLTPAEYLYILQKSMNDPTAPYFQELGMAIEDWIFAFMTHVLETGKPLDDFDPNDSLFLLRSVLSQRYSSVSAVPIVLWNHSYQQASFGLASFDTSQEYGIRTSVIL